MNAQNKDTPNDNHHDNDPTNDQGTTHTATNKASGSASETKSDTVADGEVNPHADIANLGYEQAREELTQIVATLESGRAPLEESMRLWERGEALADHAQRWLDGASSRIDAALARRAESREAAAKAGEEESDSSQH